jgi:23S rRNA (cytidine1920-2'-O)/16S rRNA (cytidine1409-2'-O)-methyltransferase
MPRFTRSAFLDMPPTRSYAGSSMAKWRADALLVERGFYDSREQARAAVLAGFVFSGDRAITKPGLLLPDTSELRVLRRPRFVSRGGDKLEHALRVFGVATAGVIAVDLGASTGGFTDCLLQHGAQRVYAVDVGYGQLDYRLRQDERVTVMERLNARYLEALPEPVDLATVDVSFISLTKVLGPLHRLVRSEGRVVALVKPQFEAERIEVQRGGVVRDPLARARVLGRTVAWTARHGYRLLGLTRSPLLGPAGNVEFFIDLRRVDQDPSVNQTGPRSEQ